MTSRIRVATAIVVIGERADIRQIGYYPDLRYRFHAHPVLRESNDVNSLSPDIFQLFYQLVIVQKLVKRSFFSLVKFLIFVPRKFYIISESRTLTS